MGSLKDAFDGGDQRKALEALRDHILAELEKGHKDGDTSALILRLLGVMDRLEALPDPHASEEDELAALRGRKKGMPEPEDDVAQRKFGKKSSSRRVVGRRNAAQ